MSTKLLPLLSGASAVARNESATIQYPLPSGATAAPSPPVDYVRCVAWDSAENHETHRLLARWGFNNPDTPLILKDSEALGRGMGGVGQVGRGPVFPLLDPQLDNDPEYTYPLPPDFAALARTGWSTSRRAELPPMVKGEFPEYSPTASWRWNQKQTSAVLVPGSTGSLTVTYLVSGYGQFLVSVQQLGNDLAGNVVDIPHGAEITLSDAPSWAGVLGYTSPSGVTFSRETDGRWRVVLEFTNIFYEFPPSAGGATGWGAYSQHAVVYQGTTAPTYPELLDHTSLVTGSSNAYRFLVVSDGDYDVGVMYGPAAWAPAATPDYRNYPLQYRWLGWTIRILNGVGTVLSTQTASASYTPLWAPKVEFRDGVWQITVEVADFPSTIAATPSGSVRRVFLRGPGLLGGGQCVGAEVCEPGDWLAKFQKGDLNSPNGTEHSVSFTDWSSEAYPVEFPLNPLVRPLRDPVDDGLFVFHWRGVPPTAYADEVVDDKLFAGAGLRLLWSSPWTAAGVIPRETVRLTWKIGDDGYGSQETLPTTYDLPVSQLVSTCLIVIPTTRVWRIVVNGAEIGTGTLSMTSEQLNRALWAQYSILSPKYYCYAGLLSRFCVIQGTGVTEDWAESLTSSAPPLPSERGWGT